MNVLWQRLKDCFNVVIITKSINSIPAFLQIPVLINEYTISSENERFCWSKFPTDDKIKCQQWI